MASSSEQHNLRFGIEVVGGNAETEIANAIHRVMRAANAASKDGGGFLDPSVAAAFGHEIERAVTKAFQLDVASTPLYQSMRREDQKLLLSPSRSQYNSIGGSSELVSKQIALVNANLALERALATRVKTYTVRDPTSRFVGEELKGYGSKTKRDEAIVRASGVVSRAEVALARELETRAVKEAKAGQAADKAASDEITARLKATLGTVQNTARREAATRKVIEIEENAASKDAAARLRSAFKITQNAAKNRDGAAKADVNAMEATARVTVSMIARRKAADAAAAADEALARNQASADAARNFPVSFPITDPTTRVGRAQDKVNIAERNVAIAEENLAQIRLSQTRTAEQELRGQNRLAASNDALYAAQQRLLDETKRAADALAKNAETGQRGVVGQFALGFTGTSGRGFVEQIGQAFKFSIFYGTAYKLLFALTQTFQQTLQEGIAFQQQVTELQLATGRTREQADKLASAFGDYATQYGFSASQGAQIGARAQGFYGTTDASMATQRAVGSTSSRIVNQVAFASGAQPADIQGNLAAVAQSYGLGYQSQQYIADLDAYFSRKFGIGQGQTIDAIAQSGTVGKAAGFSPAEVGAIAADIQARTNASPSATGGYLAQIFSRAGEGSLTKLSSKYGIDSSADFATQFKALAQIYKTRPGERDDISAAFGRGKVQNAVISLLQDFDTVLATSKAATKDAPGESDRAAALKIADIGGQIQQTVGALKDFSKELGQTGILTILGAIAVTARDALGGLTEVLSIFNELPRRLRTTIAALGVLALAARGAAVAQGLKGGATELLFARPIAAVPGNTAIVATLTAEADAAALAASALASQAAAATAAVEAAAASLAVAEASVASLAVVVEESAGAGAAASEARTAATERLAAAEVEAAAAAERHTAALLQESVATTEAASAAVVDANAQIGLAAAEAEGSAAAAAGSSGGLLRGSNLKGVGLAALALVDLALVNKVRDTAKEQTAARRSFRQLEATPGDALDTGSGQLARAATAREVAKQNKDASEGRFDRLRNAGFSALIGRAGPDARDAAARAEAAKDVERLATRNAKLIDDYNSRIDPTQALISGFDADSVKTSLDAITAAGGTAKEQFDALAASVGASGEAASRAAATYNPDVLAASGSSELLSRFIKNPGVELTSQPNAAGKLVDGFINDSVLGTVGLNGPFKTKDLTKDIYSKALTQGGVQKRLGKALSEIGSLAELDPATIETLATQIVGSTASDVIKASDGKYTNKDYDKIRAGLIDQAKAFLEDLREKAIGVGNVVALTNEELTLLADDALAAAQQAIDDLPATSHNERIDQARAAVRVLERYIRSTPTGANPQAQKDLQAANDLLAQSQFDRLEGLREVAQRNADSQKQAAALGRNFLRKELRSAVNNNSPDTLAQIIAQAGTAAIRIARQMIRQAEKAARAKAAQDAKVQSLVGYLTTGDLNKAGQTGTGDFDPTALGEAIGTTASAEDGSNVYDGSGAGGTKETAADKAVARAQANAIRQQGAIPAARADILAAKVAMDQAKKGSVEYYNALGQYYTARQSLTDAVIAYRENLYLLGHDATNPLVQARAAVLAAAAQLNADRASGASPDALAADRVALQSAQANAESTKFSQRLEAVQTADELGRISHQRYLNYLDHEHDRLTGIKNRTYQQQQELDQIDGLMKSAADAMAGQWNFGDIKLPTPYEVQRRLQEVYGTNAGGLNNSSDPFLPSGAIGNIHAGSQSTQIFINGADIGAVRKVLKEVLGDRAITSTTASRHR